MAEQINLTAAFGPTTGIWKVKTLIFDLGLTSDASSFIAKPLESVVRVVLMGLNKQTFPHNWEGSAADTDIKAMNTMNFTTISMQKRTFNKLIAEGVTPGTISGAPD